MSHEREPGLDSAQASEFRRACRRLDCEGGGVAGTLLEAWPDYIVLTELDGTIRFANARYAEILGQSTDEIVGRDVGEFVSETERGVVASNLERLRQGEHLPTYERRFVDRNGNERIVEISASTLFDPSGAPAGVLSIGRDVSEDRRTEVFIRRLVEGAAGAVGAEYLDRFSLALVQAYGVAAAGILPVDPADGTLRGGSYAVSGQLLTGYPSLADHTPHHAVANGDRIQIEKDARSLYPADRELDRLEIESYTGLPLTARDGTMLGVLFLMDSRPATLDLEQWALRAFVDRAVLELENLEQRRVAEREARRRHRLLSHVPAALYEREPDPSLAPDFLGSEVKDITGWPRASCERPLDEWLELVDESDRRRVRATIGAALEGRMPYRVEFRVVGQEGEVRWIRDEATPVLEDGRDIYAGVLLDVTAQRLFQDQVSNSRRLESVGFLAAGVAHDFNNLLMTSIGQLSLAKAEQDDGEDVSTRLVEIEKTLVRAAGLTRQLQSLSKGGDPIREPMDLRDMIRRTVRFATDGTKVAMRFEFEHDLWPCLADEGQMAQVVENLALNAMQAMPDGGELVVRASNEEIQTVGPMPLGVGRYVRFSVTDSGQGMAPSILNQIFDPYFSTKEKGFGLGLASSHAIVRRHGGHLYAESSPGKGTTMTFYVMAADAREPDDPESGATQLLRGSSRALVLDDDPAVRSVVVRMLRRLGLEVVTASTGEEAIDLVRAQTEADHPIDFALLDLTIRDGLGGRQAAREIRLLEPELPLIATSGYSEDPIMSSYEEYGFDGSIPKPYTMEQLRRLIGGV